LVYYSFSSFVRQDYEILSNHFDVRRVRYSSLKDVVSILGAVLRSDVTFSWFAGGHAFLAVLFSKIFGKRSIVVVGATMSHTFHRWITASSPRHGIKRQ